MRDNITLDSPLLDYLRGWIGFRSAASFCKAIGWSRQKYNWKINADREIGVSVILEIWEVAQKNGISQEEYIKILFEWFSHRITHEKKTHPQP